MTRLERNLTALAVGILLGVWMGASFATGELPVVKPPIVKPPVIVPPPVVPPVVTPPAVSPPVTQAPATQPGPASASSSGSAWAGAIAFGVVATYFAAVIRQHYLWCLEDDRKPEQERRCYRPLKDGMPK